MALLKDEIIVLKGINYSEADKIITVFSKNRGKYSLIAKGVRKIESKNRPSIQTLSHSSITYYEGTNLSVLVEASLIYIPEVDKEKMNNVAKVLRLINKLAPEEVEDVELFNALQRIVKQDYDLRSVNKFRIWVLEHLGFLSDMRKCNVCGKSDKINKIDLNRMIVICDNCLGSKVTIRNLSEIRDIKYESLAFDNAIDKYIDNIIEGGNE